jgi:hypothetical protein
MAMGYIQSVCVTISFTSTSSTQNCTLSSYNLN